MAYKCVCSIKEYLHTLLMTALLKNFKMGSHSNKLLMVLLSSHLVFESPVMLTECVYATVHWLDGITACCKTIIKQAFMNSQSQIA